MNQMKSSKILDEKRIYIQNLCLVDVINVDFRVVLYALLDYLHCVLFLFREFYPLIWISCLMMKSRIYHFKATLSSTDTVILHSTINFLFFFYCTVMFVYSILNLQFDVKPESITTFDKLKLKWFIVHRFLWFANFFFC